MAAGCNVNLSKVRAAEKSCQVYALLLYILKRYCNDDKLYVQIVKKRSALKIGEGGPCILRLFYNSS